MMNESKDDIQKLTRPFPNKHPDTIYALALDRLHGQQEHIASLESKIANVLGFSSALTAIMATFVALRDGQVCYNSFVSFIIAGIAFIAIVVSSLVGLFLRRWEVGPSLDKAWEHAHKSEYDESTLGWWAAESLTKCYKNNQDGVKLKIRAAKSNIILIVIQAVAVGLGLSFEFLI